MKHIFIIAALTVTMCTVATSQSGSINNTLGTSGSFIIKDGSTTFFTLAQSNGYLNLTKSISLAYTTGSTLGVIFKGADRFVHDYHGSGTYGFNTFVGVNAGNFTMGGTNGQASNNTAIGNSALYFLTSGYDNSAAGSYSLFNNTTGDGNTASGSHSLFSNTTGYDNAALGYQSLYSNTTGVFNSAFGYQSLYSNTTGISNSAFGYFSLKYTSIGGSNNAFGAYAMYANTTGNGNSAFGFAALTSNTTGVSNCAFGFASLHNNVTGTFSAGFGYATLFNTTGSYNSALGDSAGYDLTTGSNNTLVGYNARPSSVTVSNEITLGNSYVSTLRCNTSTISSLSDARDKRNIRDLPLGLDFLMTVKPRLFNWDRREWYKDGKPNGSKMKQEPTAGFIAQELDTAQTKAHAEWLNLVLKTNPNRMEATSGNLLPIMVKAIQDLKSENDVLKNELATLRASIAEQVRQEVQNALAEASRNGILTNSTSGR